MKIAILSDIHGNIDALVAAYKAATEVNPDKIYHLGDLGGYAPFVNEVVDFLIEHKIEGVQGNYDHTVATDAEHCGCKYEDPIQSALATQSFEWTKKHVSQQSIAYMAGLPNIIEFQTDGRRVALFHATPHKNNIYWLEERDEKFFLEMAGKVDADVMIYGHTHKPYRKDIDSKVFINAGSVGKPKDGDPRACIAIVDITSDGVKSDFIRALYNTQKVADDIKQSELPDQFSENLLNAR